MSLWQTIFVCIFCLSCSSDVNSQLPTSATNNNAMDLLFMIDCSYYITETNFRTVLKSVLNYIETLPVGPDQVNVATISYSVVAKRTDFTGDIQRLRTDIPNLFYDGQTSLTHVAFDEALTAMTAQRSLRPNAKKVVIVVTESISFYPSESRRSSDRLKDIGVEIWAVGIGPNVNRLELIGFTDSLSRTVFSTRFDVLPAINLGLSDSVSVVPTGAVPISSAVTTSLTMEASNTISFLISELRSTQNLIGTPVSVGSQDGATTVVVASTSANVYTSATPTTTAYTSMTPSATAYILLTPTPTTNTILTPSATASDLLTSSVAPGQDTRNTTNSSNDNDNVSAKSTEVTFTSSVTKTAPIMQTFSTLNILFSEFISTRIMTGTQASGTSQVVKTEDAVTSTFVNIYISTTPTAIAYTSVTPTATAYTSVTPTATAYAFTTPSAASYTTLTPTATESDSPMSSVVSGQDPQNNTKGSHDKDGPGDGSAVFNSSTDGICIHAVSLKGFGYVPHPRDCDKFLQCHKSQDGTVTASVRFCPRGLFWKQANLTCVPPDQTCCTDPCTKMCGGQTYRMDGGCDLYWECIKGVSKPRRCLSYHGYIPGNGCVFMPTCVNTDTRTLNCPLSGKCEYLPMTGNSGYRLLTLSGSMEFNCWPSTVFDLASCSCRPLKDLIKHCPLVNFFNLTSEVETNNSVSNNSVIQTGCKTSGASKDAGNNNNTDCSMTRSEVLSAPSDSTRAVTLQFRYLMSTNRSSSSTPEVLFRSSACVQEQEGILVVSEDTTSLNVKVLSPAGYALSASLPLWGLNQTEWRDVYIQYFKGNVFVELTSENLVYNIYSKGGLNIPVGACGWKVGRPDELSSYLSAFTGDITEVLVSRCNEYGF